MNKLQARERIDCNWVVVESAKMRATLLKQRLQGVESLEERVHIKIEVSKMDWNELRKVFK